MKSLKQMRIEAEAIVAAGVTNKATLTEAVPLLIELQEANELAKKTAKRCHDAAKALSEACSAYALEHPSVFDEGLNLISKGVKNGDLTIEDITYHFSSGYDKPKRLNGDAMNQEFLDGLPEGWTQLKRELDTTGINRLKVEDSELEAAGLYRPEKNVWS